MLPRRIVRRQVRRDAVPRFPVIARTEQKLSAQINRSRLIGAGTDRGTPIEAKLRFARPRQRLDVLRLSRRLSEPRDHPSLVLDVRVVGVAWVGERPES